MKILFISGTFLDEALGIMQLSSILKQNGHKTDLFIGENCNLQEKVDDFNPDILAISASTGTHKTCLDEVRKLNRHIFTVIGGPHATFFPEIISNNIIDVVCIGEGDYPFLELANNIDDGDIKNIRNLWIKVDKKIYRNPLRPLIQDLDSLPFPDREIVYQFEKFRSREIKPFITGRGCPFECSYCFNHSYKKMFSGQKYVRKRSVGNVIDEIKDVRRRYGLEVVRFIDDTFNTDRKWLDEFCEKYKEIDIPFSCNIRAELLDEKLVEKLKSAGCMLLNIGIECGNERIRKTLLNKHTSNSQMLKICRLIKKAGIKLTTQNIFGLPLENSLENDFETLRFNIRCKPDYAWASIFTPYPKTALGEYSKGKYFDGNVDSLPETYHFSVLNLKNREEITNLHALFPTIVRFPFLLPISKHLIKLPFQGLFLYLMRLHKHISRKRWLKD